MKLTKCSLALLLMLVSSLSLMAQQRTISGVVRNVATQEVIPGVTVGIKGTDRNTVTNEKGEFTITVSGNESVVKFTSVGFAYSEQIVGSGNYLTINLATDNKSMDDVVVVGYGAARKRGDVLGSVAVVNPKEVEELPVANLTTALKNMAPGVGVSQSSGRPGSTTTLNIRGATTFSSGGNTEPLFVIDGIVFDGQTNGVSNGKTAFDNLDATMIENITFLKDASASIYGNKGANGVVVVTTKKGRPGKPSINYSGSYAISDAAQMPQMLSSYEHARLLNNKYYSRGFDTVKNSSGVFTGMAAFYTPDELNYLKTHDYSWVDQVWSASHLQRHTLNISGGTDRITYFAGTNYYNETGNLNDLYAKKYGFRFGSNAKLGNNLNATITVSTDNSNINRPTPKGTTITDQSDQMNGTMSALLLTPRWIPMYIGDLPVIAKLPGTTTGVPGWHPLELQKTGTYARNNTDGINMNAALDYKVPFIKGLSAKVNYGLNKRSSAGKEYYIPYDLYSFVETGVHNNIAGAGANNTFRSMNVIYTDQLLAGTAGKTNIKNGNQLQYTASNSKSYVLNESINYSNKFGKHDVALLLLAEQSEGRDEMVRTSVETQVIPGIDEFWAFSQDRSVYDHLSSTNESGRASYLGRLNYGFNDRYLFEGVLRADASPNFPPESRWGYFPSAAVGWKISEESFFRDNIHFVNNLKIRFQVGLAGNDNTRRYAYYERFTQTTGYLFGTFMSNGLNNNTIPNPNITWEKAFFRNVGLDGDLLNGRLSFGLDYFYKHTTDMLESPQVNLPTTYGASVSDFNHGELKQWGIDGSIGWSDRIGKNFRYFINTNLSLLNDNRVISRYYNELTDIGYKYPIGKRTDKGIEGYRSTGIMRTQAEVNDFLAKHPGWTINGNPLRVGALNFEDQDGDGKITETDITQIVPRAASPVGLGFNLGGSWKGLSLRANISYAIGGWSLYDKTARTSVTESANALAYWADSWSPDNPNARYPVAGSDLLNEASTFWLVKNTMMRVNNIQLGYTLPASITNRYRLPQIRAFVNGNNMWTIISQQRYKDPGSNQAVDYPILRTYTFGLSLSL